MKAELLDIPDVEYHARPELSNSKIGDFIKSRRLYKRRHVDGEKQPDHAYYAAGSLLHAMLLDPDDLWGRFRVMPRREDRGQTEGDVRRKMVTRSNADKEYFAAWAEDCRANGIAMVDPADADLMAPMVEALAAHNEAAGYLRHKDALREQTIIWTHQPTGRRMRSKLDLMNPVIDVVVDVKSAARDMGRPSERARRAWVDRGYHRQAAAYLMAYWEVYKRNALYIPTFVEKVQEPTAFLVELPVDHIAVIRGRRELDKAIREIEECERTGDWREPHEKGVVHDDFLPAYMVREDEFSVDYDGLDDVEGPGVANE